MQTRPNTTRASPRAVVAEVVEGGTGLAVALMPGPPSLVHTLHHHGRNGDWLGEVIRQRPEPPCAPGQPPAGLSCAFPPCCGRTDATFPLRFSSVAWWAKHLEVSGRVFAAVAYCQYVIQSHRILRCEVAAASGAHAALRIEQDVAGRPRPTACGLSGRGGTLAVPSPSSSSSVAQLAVEFVTL